MSPTKPDPAAVVARLEALHEATDARFSASTEAVQASSGHAIGCGSGCFSCCVDELTAWRPEADRIAALVRDNGLTIAVHPPGMCAFIAAGRCQVYAARPYVCRSQGAVLRFPSDDGWVRDTCGEHLQDADLDRLPEAATFAIGPAESELIAIATMDLEARGEKGLPERVSLRQLAEELAARDR